MQNRQEAEQAIDNDLELYALYDEGSEGLIEDYWDLDNAFDNDYRVGFELGNYHELKSEWHESREKTFDSRSFESWLEDKAESLIS